MYLWPRSVSSRPINLGGLIGSFPTCTVGLRSGEKRTFFSASFHSCLRLIRPKSNDFGPRMRERAFGSRQSLAVAPDIESPPPHLVWVLGSSTTSVIYSFVVFRWGSFRSRKISGGRCVGCTGSRQGVTEVRGRGSDRLRCRGAFLNFLRVSWRIFFPVRSTARS